MAVLEVLTEMICTVKLLARVALAELVYLLQVANAFFPILFACAQTSLGTFAAASPVKLFAAITTDVHLSRSCGAFMKRSFIAGQGCA